MILEPCRPRAPKLQKLLAGLVALCWLAAGPPAHAAEWFVAVGGSGNGARPQSPLGRIQEALDRAQPGDIVTIATGVYPEALRTARPGLRGRPITMRNSGPRGSVVVTVRGNVLRVLHADFVVDGVVFDGQYGPADTIRVTTAGHRFRLENSEVRRSSRDLIDLDAPHGVVITGCLIHHALNATNGRTDAHGIAAGAVADLTVSDSEIHTFSGDGIQVDPGRSAPGWNRVTVERTRIWLVPLPAPQNGFAAGVVPGENAIDTKASAELPRSSLLVRDVTAWGFRRGLLSNMAAFNLKENVSVLVDRITVFDSEIAFRLRGRGAATAGGAEVLVTNTVVHDVGTAFRYEDRIEGLRLWHVTVGRGVGRAFRGVQADAMNVEVRNTLVLGPRPPEARHPTNLAVDARSFVDAERHDYRLADGAPAIDAGQALPSVVADRDGHPRPAGKGADPGAYEWRPTPARR